MELKKIFDLINPLILLIRVINLLITLILRFKLILLHKLIHGFDQSLDSTLFYNP